MQLKYSEAIDCKRCGTHLPSGYYFKKEDNDYCAECAIKLDIERKGFSVCWWCKEKVKRGLEVIITHFNDDGILQFGTSCVKCWREVD